MSSSTKPAEFVSPENLGNNQKAVHYARTFMSIVAGMVIGVLGLTSTAGFFAYALCYATISGALLARMDFDLPKYLPGISVASFLLDGIAGQGMSFLLFWTLSFALAGGVY